MQVALEATACVLIAQKIDSETYGVGKFLDASLQAYNAVIDPDPNLSAKLGYKGTLEGLLRHEMRVVQCLRFDFEVPIPLSEQHLQPVVGRFCLKEVEVYALRKILKHIAYKFSDICIKHSFQDILLAALQIAAHKGRFKLVLELSVGEKERSEDIVKQLKVMKYTTLPKLEVIHSYDSFTYVLFGM